LIALQNKVLDNWGCRYQQGKSGNLVKTPDLFGDITRQPGALRSGSRKKRFIRCPKNGTVIAKQNNLTAIGRY
jgi:hypothetical protein